MGRPLPNFPSEKIKLSPEWMQFTKDPRIIAIHDLSYPSFLDNYEEPSIIPGEESDTETETYELEPPRIENWRCQVYDRGLTFEDLGFGGCPCC